MDKCLLKWLVFFSFQWVCLNSVNGQSTRLLFSSSEIESATKNDSIVKLNYIPFTGKLKVKYLNGTVDRIHYSRVWGYMKKGKIYRQFKGWFYEIINLQKPITYQTFQRIGGNLRKVNFTSETLDSPLSPK